MCLLFSQDRAEGNDHTDAVGALLRLDALTNPGPGCAAPIDINKGDVNRDVLEGIPLVGHLMIVTFIEHFPCTIIWTEGW